MSKDPLQWQLLKENKCPDCHRDLTKHSATIVNSSDFGNLQTVIQCDCGFKIREIRYAQIVSSMVQGDLDAKLIEKMEEENR